MISSVGWIPARLKAKDRSFTSYPFALSIHLRYRFPDDPWALHTYAGYTKNLYIFQKLRSSGQLRLPSLLDRFSGVSGAILVMMMTTRSHTRIFRLLGLRMMVCFCPAALSGFIVIAWGQAYRGSSESKPVDCQ